MKSSAEVFSEIELKIDLAWYQEMCDTTKPQRWLSGASYAYWETRSGKHLRDWYNLDIIGHLYSKRVEYLEVFHKHSQQGSVELANEEFNQCDFGDTQRQCEYCETSFYPLKDLAAVMASAGEKIWNYERRRFCVKDCSQNYKWMMVIRKGMGPNATFDKSLTRRAIWEEFGPHCYLCGIEAIYNQEDLWIRHGTKAWKQRWGDYQRGDRNRIAVVEHILPRSKGGEHIRGNVKIACSKCNLLKGDRDFSPLVAPDEDIDD